MTSPDTPIIVGVGQFVERLDAADYRGLSPVDVAAEAARLAFADALSLEQLAEHVDTIATTRTFEDSSPHMAMPFGKSNNYPRSIANRLGLDPTRAIWEAAGGNTPQHLVSECCEKIAAGAMRMALLAGSEAISTARHLAAQGKQVDWSETVEGQVEDRRAGAEGMLSEHEADHGLRGAPPLYGLCENARRGRLGQSRQAYARSMGELFAPFSRTASENPYSSTATVYSLEELITPTDRNRMIADPYPRLLVARDQVNQGAAVLITSVAIARELGIPEAQWVYLHGYADATERPLLERQDIGASPAAQLAATTALQCASITAEEIDYFDLYSCFPIAVSNVCDGLGIGADDPRPLTLTGGLPYFGGPGNNYSMHGIAAMVEQLRTDPDAFGLVGANGGFLSKYSVGIYSTRHAAFKPCDSGPLQAAIDGLPAPAIEYQAEGWGTVETYTLLFGKDQQPTTGIVVGRLENGARFLAMTGRDDSATLRRMVADDPLGLQVFVRPVGKINLFSFEEIAAS